MNKQAFDQVAKVHVVGAGGIGVSAIARMFLDTGARVTGSDMSRSRITEALEESGASLFYKQSAQNVPADVDLVVHTIAVSDNNPELVRARKIGATVMSYPEVLGLISRAYRTIAVSGTHGKTTTTAMIAETLIHAGMSPTVIVGSLLRTFASNYVRGEGDLFVVEACEYRESFAHITPSILVITNIEADHLDYYRDLADIERAFKTLACKVPRDGYIVTNMKNESVRRVVSDVEAQVVDFTSETHSIRLSVPGAHNRENAAAALEAARTLDVDEKKARSSLEAFEGTWRRFEYKGDMSDGYRVYDDYAHHPSEIRATLAAARERHSHAHITAVFQPHLFSRTKEFLHDFARAFDEADSVVLLPIYKAREQDDGSVSIDDVVHEMKTHHDDVHFCETQDSAIGFVHSHLGERSDNAIVITLGAGDVYQVGEALVTEETL